MTVVRIIICPSIRLWTVFWYITNTSVDGCQYHRISVYPPVDSLWVHHHYKTDDGCQHHHISVYPPVDSLLVHHHYKTGDGCQEKKYAHLSACGQSSGTSPILVLTVVSIIIYPSIRLWSFLLVHHTNFLKGNSLDYL